MKRRLLFAISQFYKGGAETSLLNLLKRLDRDRFDIDLIIMAQSPAENAVSLIPELPEHVHVLDVYQQEQHMGFVRRVRRKLLCTQDDLERFPASALLYVRGKVYDWAFHVGEWWMPDFVAYKVNAARKAAWIHCDISLDQMFQDEAFFTSESHIDHYIFASERSKDSACKKYPFLSSKAVCIYNITNVQKVREQAQETVEPLTKDKLPVLLTCANIRREKNHMRQLQAMGLLKDRGVDFVWVNIGSTADEGRTAELKACARRMGLQDRFLILGPRKNPAPYMTQADAVTVLSDYESWSMVITEAKVLGVPVIATKTSGALEQIEDKKTGILCDFTPEDIADRIELFLTSKALQSEIRKNIRNFDNTAEIIASFEALLSSQADEPQGKRVLYIIDNINYSGGAHVATKLQIQQLLSQGHNIAVFSSEVPKTAVRSELQGTCFLGWGNFAANQLYHRRLLDCLTDPTLSREEKRYKLRLTWRGKIRKDTNLFNNLVLPRLSDLFSAFDVVCVTSEGSGFRSAVANSSCGWKVQYIHTDYCAWRTLSDWTMNSTENDGEIYEKFDRIVLLSDRIRNSFLSLYPHLAGKAVVNQNLMPADQIRRKAERPQLQGSPANFITVSRIDRFKGFDRGYQAFQRLYEEGFRFTWTIVGDGEEFAEMKALFEKSEFSDLVKMVGAKKNPFQLVKEADVFALFSRYEGLPNSIYEAMILGIPVIATNVGGIDSQIEKGVNGWLVDSSSEAVYEGLKHILLHPEEIDRFKEALKGYRYNNEAISRRTEEILFG